MFVFPEALFFSPPAFYFLPPSLSPSAGSSRGSRLWGTWKGGYSKCCKTTEKRQNLCQQKTLGGEWEPSWAGPASLKKPGGGGRASRKQARCWKKKKKKNAARTLSSWCIWTIPSNKSSSGSFHVLAHGGMLKPAVVLSWTLRLGPLFISI